MKKDYIRLIKKKEVATIVLNNPDGLNLIDYDFLNSFYEKLIKLDKDDKIRIILLKSAQDFFSAGIDWGKLQGYSLQTTKDFFNLSNKCINLLMQTNKITVSQIKGNAYGEGLALSLACDFKIASEPALFGLPQIAYGFIPMFNVIPHLITLIGETYANELIYAGEIVNGLRAEQIGLVNIAVRPENLKMETERLINNILSNQNPEILRYKSILKKIDPIKQALIEKMSLDNLLKFQKDKKKLKNFKLFLKSRCKV